MVFYFLVTALEYKNQGKNCKKFLKIVKQNDKELLRVLAMAT